MVVKLYVGRKWKQISMHFRANFQHSLYKNMENIPEDRSGSWTTVTVATCWV